MKPGRSFTGARTPRLALLFALLGLSSGCLTAKPDIKTASPNLRLPKPSNVSTTPREVPPKPADAPTPVSVRTPPAPDAGPTMTGPGVTVNSGRSFSGDPTATGSLPVAPVRVPPNVAQMSPIPVNGVYTANPPGAPAPVERTAGANGGFVVPTVLATPVAPPEPTPPVPPAPIKIGTPSSPGGS